MDFELIAEAVPQLVAAVDETILLAFSSICLGLVLAVLIALMRVSKLVPLSGFAICFVYVFRSTPLLVQIFLIYYGSGQFRGILESAGLWIFFRDAWFCAIFTLVLNTAAYGSEVIRGGIQSVPLGQIEAARALGMSGPKLYMCVVFPIALRMALPAYGNEIILVVKATSLASTITILEITGIAKKIIASTYQPIEIFLIAGGIYLLINFVLTRAIAWLEEWLNPHLRVMRGGKREVTNAPRTSKY